MSNPIKIGISSCLLGNPVRFDGGHSHDRFLTQTLGRFTQYIPVCPEVECGMSVPRDSLRLVGDPESPRLVTRKDGTDHTDQMQSWIAERLEDLETENLCGFIFRSKSPSSGLYRIRVYGEDGKVRKTGTGLFARAFRERFPRIPVEESGRLHDPKLRENFIENIFTLQRWRQLLEKGKTLGGLVDFHTRNKLLILSHSTEIYRQMGRTVAQGKGEEPEALFDAYEASLLKALSLKTTIKKNINVLQHIMGYFKKQTTSQEKQELLALFEQYRMEHLPLIVPLTLINHYVTKYDNPWLKSQTYLNPHPMELKLRTYF
ncbi:MAG: DUF523 and DUF1722 domain-containing protein [Desulfobacterales bacterium]|nr:DUF523 and DUF1722 domain-containing protein [Desulfobacterales bacterium]